MEVSADVIEQIEIDARYETYIKREAAQVAKIKRLETWPIPETFDYMTVDGMRTEAQAKMAKFRALMRFFSSSQTSLSTGILCCLSLKITPVASDW